MSISEEDKSQIPDATSRKTTILKQIPRASLFCSIVRDDFEGAEKANIKHGIMGDMLTLLPNISAIWNEILPILLQGKTNKKLLMKESFRPNFAPCYGKVCGLFAELVGIFAKDPNNELYTQHTFSDEFLQLAIFAIEHTHRLLASEIFGTSSTGGTEIIAKCFELLRTFNEFFFAVAKVKCNVMLQERHLSALQKIISGFYKLLQENLLRSAAGVLQPKRQAAVARFAYFVLQTIAAMAVFGEAPGLSKKKYAYILEKFQTTFAFISSSKSIEAIFSELYEFEHEWQTQDRVKYTLSSFNQKRLSIYVLPDKLSSGPQKNLRFSLKYVAICYNYKILRMISERTNLNYDERFLSAFCPLVKKNKELLSSMLSSKEPIDPMGVMLLLNENVTIIKSYILSLAHFSAKLDRTQTQPKYALIKETAIDSLCLGIKAGMHSVVQTRHEVDDLSIFFASDLIALVFKSLLSFRVRRSVRPPSFKYEQETISHANSLISDLTTMFIHTNDAVCTYTYRLYLLQFINAWDAQELKEKHVKYVEEMSRILNDTEGSREGELVDYLKERSFDVALNIYVKLSSLDCSTPVESTLRSIKESANNEKQLFKYFYILECLLCKSKLQTEDFDRIQNGDFGFCADLFGSVGDSKESDTFISRDGMGLLLGIYKSASVCYLQRQKARAQAAERSLENNGLSPSLEVNNYIVQTILKEMDSAISAYKKIADQTGAFILALSIMPPIAKYCLTCPCMEHDFYEATIQTAGGRSFLLALLKTFGTHILKSFHDPELVERYVAMLTDTFVRLGEDGMSPEDEKSMFAEISQLLKALVSERGVIFLVLMGVGDRGDDAGERDDI